MNKINVQGVEMTVEEAEAKAAAALDAMSLSCLAETFDWTEDQEMSDWMPTFRGWVMDALERRSPELFAEWMENFGQSAREAFKV